MWGGGGGACPPTHSNAEQKPNEQKGRARCGGVGREVEVKVLRHAAAAPKDNGRAVREREPGRGCAAHSQGKRQHHQEELEHCRRIEGGERLARHVEGGGKVG